MRGKKYLQLVLNLELEIYSVAAAVTVAVAAASRHFAAGVVLALTHTFAYFF